MKVYLLSIPTNSISEKIIQQLMFNIKSDPYSLANLLIISIPIFFDLKILHFLHV